jgi:hypothetical protein
MQRKGRGKPQKSARTCCRETSSSSVSEDGGDVVLLSNCATSSGKSLFSSLSVGAAMAVGERNKNQKLEDQST